MHILYIHQYFTTPLGRSGIRSYEFARQWVAKGHRVTMLTSTAALTEMDLANAKGRVFKRFQIEGVDVLALNMSYKQQMSMIRRCWAFLLFLLMASVAVLFVKKVDLVYASSTPLTVGIPSLVAKWFKRQQFIFEVRDQWPATVVEVGALKNKFSIKFLLWFEKLVYRNSSLIVAISDGMANDIKKLVKKTKPVITIPNGSDLDIFSPDVDGSGFREKRNWNNKLVLLHAGSMGRINGLEIIVDVAEKIKKQTDILFVFVGHGKNESILRDKVSKLGLTNVEFIPAVPKQELPTILAASDVAMAVIGNFPIIERHASLNKFYDGLSAGRCVLLNYSGWQKDLLEEYNAGLGCKLCDIDEFAQKVLYLNSNRQQVKKMGQNARRLAIEQFDRNKLAEQLLEQIQAQQEKNSHR